MLASKSYMIALALVEGHYSVDDAAMAAHVEVQSQINRWGEVEDSASRPLFSGRGLTLTLVPSSSSRCRPPGCAGTTRVRRAAVQHERMKRESHCPCSHSFEHAGLQRGFC